MKPARHVGHCCQCGAVRVAVNATHHCRACEADLEEADAIATAKADLEAAREELVDAENACSHYAGPSRYRDAADRRHAAAVQAEAAAAKAVAFWAALHAVDRDLDVVEAGLEKRTTALRAVGHDLDAVAARLVALEKRTT